MKKLLFTLLLIVPFTTGCANVETLITINDDNSASVRNTLFYDGDINNSVDSTAQALLDNYKFYVDDEYSVNVKTENDKSNIVATKSVENLSKYDLDLSSLGFSPANDKTRYIEVNKNFFITSYNIDLVYNYQNSVNKYANLKQKEVELAPVFNPEYYHKYVDKSETEGAIHVVQTVEPDVDEISYNDDDVLGIDAVVKIKVPMFASYNNADDADGNVYIWYVDKQKPTYIKLQYVKYSSFAICLALVCGLMLLVLLSVRIINHETQKRVDNLDNIV